MADELILPAHLDKERKKQEAKFAAQSTIDAIESALKAADLEPTPTLMGAMVWLASFHGTALGITKEKMHAVVEEGYANFAKGNPKHKPDENTKES